MDEDRQSGLARVHTAVAKPLRGNVVAIAATAAVIVALAIAVASVDRAASPLARCVSLENQGNLGAAIGACTDAVNVGKGSKSAIVAAERLDVLRPRLAAIEYARHAERDKVPDVVTEGWCDRLKERLSDRYLSGELIDQAGKKYSLRHPASHLREVISEHLDNEVVSCKDDAGKPTAGYWQCKWNSTHSNYHQCRRASERRARTFGADTAEAAPQPTSPTVATSAPMVQDILRQWLEAQNRQDFETYRSLYSPAFVGVKRAGEKATEYRRREWLNDRRGMFAKGFTVTADGAQVEVTPHGTIVTFTQEWRSAAYGDRGIKRLILEEDGGRLLITREELLTSERIRTATAGTDAPAGTRSSNATADARVAADIEQQRPEQESHDAQAVLARAVRKVRVSYLWTSEPDSVCTGKGLPPYQKVYEGGTFAEDELVAYADGCQHSMHISVTPGMPKGVEATYFCCPQARKTVGR
jgi:hypothetical protein